MGIKKITKLLEKRTDLVERLNTATSHIDRRWLLAIITSWMSIDELEKTVKFQEEHK